MKPIVNLGLDADASFVPHLDEIAEKFGALGYPKPLLLCYTKVITAAQLTAQKAKGFPTALIFEVGTDNSLGGADQGNIDGKRCVEQMQAIGAPKNTGIFLTTDRDVSVDEDLSAVEDYWAAADFYIYGAGYRIGGYADGTELQALHNHGMNFTWLAGATAWNGSKTLLASPMLDMVQGIIRPGATWMGIAWPEIAGLDYDPDLILSTDVGQIV